jgi:hypothetical protein
MQVKLLLNERKKKEKMRIFARHGTSFKSCAGEE